MINFHTVVVKPIQKCIPKTSKLYITYAVFPVSQKLVSSA